MMYSISDKPKVCPVCQSEPSSSQPEDVIATSMRCGAQWYKEQLVGRDLKVYTGWIPLKQCPWATIIAIELLAGKLYAADTPRFKQAGQ